MNEIDYNKIAWDSIAKEHYENYQKRLKEEDTLLSPWIIEELGDITGKRILHLQCNTGADSICLARLGASVVGVDLSDVNVYYARLLALENKADCVFITSDVLKLDELELGTFDIVFTSEGAIGWLPDLKKWGCILHRHTKSDGFAYINDIHPFFLMLEEDDFAKEKFTLQYPYFLKLADESEWIGGYAGTSKKAKNYYWMYTMSEVINSLIQAGFQIDYVNEKDTLCYKLGDMEKIATAMYRFPSYQHKIPMSFSIKASIRVKREYRDC